jgi:protein AATF/BFR2
LFDALAENNPSIASPSKKRKLGVENSIGQCWKALEDRYQSFASYRDTSLDRWHRKTMLTSGSKSSMKILNQGISKQVDLLMKDQEKIAERSRVPMNQFKALCQLENAQVSCSLNDLMDVYV